jgi:hypothetical protein
MIQSADVAEAALGSPTAADYVLTMFFGAAALRIADQAQIKQRDDGADPGDRS